MLALAAFVLTSTTFSRGGTMPLSAVYQGCGGQNSSPALAWRGAPKAAKSFALIAHDPDAPHPGGWYHWVYYDIASTTHAIPRSCSSSCLNGARPERRQIQNPGLGRNDFNQVIYDGPCPPPGPPHHYNFTLYALDIARVDGEHLTGPQLLRAMRGHILAQTTLTGLYGR